MESPASFQGGTTHKMAASPTAAYTVWHPRALYFDSSTAACKTKLCISWRFGLVELAGQAAWSLRAQPPCSRDAQGESNRPSSTGNNCCYYPGTLLAAICYSAPGWLIHTQQSSRELCLDYNGSARHRTGGCSNSSRH